MDNKDFLLPAHSPPFLFCVLLVSLRLLVLLIGPTDQTSLLESEGAATCMTMLADDLQVTHTHRH